MIVNYIGGNMGNVLELCALRLPMFNNINSFKEVFFYYEQHVLQPEQPKHVPGR